MQNYQDKPDDYFAHARRDIAPLLPAKLGRVLEVGCGNGATLAWLRSEREATQTVGVEISAQAAAVAAPRVDEVHCLDFELESLPAHACSFDLVLCLDVLEHMVNPWNALARLAEGYLVPGGTLIVSLPNVRHYSVLLPLVFSGSWAYTDAGILDRTHLRFFTRKSALQLLQHSRLKNIRGTGKEFGLTSRKGLFNVLTMGLFDDFVTYQHLIAARAEE